MKNGIFYCKNKVKANINVYLNSEKLKMATKFTPLNLIRQTNSKHSGAVIFFHGSGDTGRGVRDWVKLLKGNDLQFPHLQVYYPTAPLQPYTPLNGELSNVWFDRLEINPFVPEDKPSLDKITSDLVDFIKVQVAQGISLNRIIIGGFSMGGTLSLHLAYRYLPEVAGVFSLSSFLNNESFVYNELKDANDKRKEIPLFMCHGDRDNMVPMEWAQNTYKNLVKFGINAQFVQIKNTMHELKKSEIEKLNEWILKVLPPLTTDV